MWTQNTIVKFCFYSSFHVLQPFSQCTLSACHGDSAVELVVEPDILQDEVIQEGQTYLSTDSKLEPEFLKPFYGQNSMGELSVQQRRELIKKCQSNSEDMPKWVNGMLIDPSPPSVYICQGTIEDRESVHASDGLSWTSRGRTARTIPNKVTSIYYVATPDESKMSVEQKDARDHAIGGDITYRKILSYPEEGQFIINEYLGDHEAFPWRKRQQLSCRLKKNMMPYGKKRAGFARKPIKKKLQSELRVIHCTLKILFGQKIHKR
jgi:hypothetical protein